LTAPKNPKIWQRTFTPKFWNFIHTDPYKNCPNYLVLLLISKINHSNVKNCLCPWLFCSITAPPIFATFWGPKISMILTPCHPKKIAIWTNKPEPWYEVSSQNWSQMAWRFPHDHIECITRKIPIPSIIIINHHHNSTLWPCMVFRRSTNYNI
jgi:hypothetical protein